MTRESTNFRTLNTCHTCSNCRRLRIDDGEDNNEFMRCAFMPGEVAKNTVCDYFYLENIQESMGITIYSDSFDTTNITGWLNADPYVHDTNPPWPE